MEKSSIIDKAKRIGSRIGFHFFSLGLGVLTQAFVSPAASSGVEINSIGILTYFSLLLMFPHHGNRSASALGLIVAVAGIFTGYWPAGLFFGALAAFVVNTVHRWVGHEAFLKGSIVSLIFLFASVGTGASALLFSMPLWYKLLCGAAAVAGIFRPHAVVRFVDKIKQKLRKARTAPSVEKKAAPSPATPFDAFQEMLADIERLKRRLPSDMLQSVSVIESKTRAIIQCMQDDPRDASRGTQFLNRYLPMIHTSIDRFVWISAQDRSSPELMQTKALTQQALSDMSHAFNDMHQRLLENNRNDLMVDLRVMDKLIKSEGYTPPKK